LKTGSGCRKFAGFGFSGVEPSGVVKTHFALYE